MRAVGERDQLILVAKRLPRQHRAEYLALHDLHILPRVLEERRLEV